jgi:predicted transposase YbfD/YdcC
MTRHSLALIDVFSSIPDFRQSKGKRHPLKAILSLAACAMMCGYRSYSAIAEWGRYYGQDLASALGFTHSTPCASTLHTIFRNLDKQAFEARLGQWAEAVTASVPIAPPQFEPVAVDGKSLRGSRKQGAPAAHLLSAVGHRLGLTLAQEAVGDETNEIPVVSRMLKRLLLEGRVITMDALLTQQEIAQTIVDRGGDYLMVVKDNQLGLKKWIESVFEASLWLREPVESAQTLDIGHGRIELRKLETSTALSGCEAWPGLEQVLKIERRVIQKKSRHQSKEVVFGVTSLTRRQMTVERLLEMMRGHWHIENKSHWVRDVTYDEDRSQVRSGNIPQVMAALRNTVIGVMRKAGETNIAAACRKYAAQPWSALALIGIKPEN